MTHSDAPPGTPPTGSNDAVQARQALLLWYEGRRRSLPWRTDSDPYRVWISEIMLQQTTVKSVLHYYERFLDAFPNVFELARSPVDRVLASWSGLGYYSRARNLHAAAREIVRDHGGRFPSDREQALALPGVGSYTAAAVLSIAYGAPLAVVDGNVARVLARFRGIEGPVKSAAVRRCLEEAAAEFLDRGRPGDFNQSMMELGALVCLPRNPLCGECPLSGSCRARLEGRTSDLPEAPAPRAHRSESVAVAVIESRGRLLFQKRPAGPGLMPGLWELPNLPSDDRAAEWELGERFENWLRREIHPSIRVGVRLGTARHAIMTRRIRLHAFRCGIDPGAPVGPGRRWVAHADVHKLGTSSIVRKCLVLHATAEGGSPA